MPVPMPPESTGGQSAATITRATTLAEVVQQLTFRGCPDLTDQLDLDKCSEIPYLGGSFGDIWHGKLQDGGTVAVKCLRWYSHTPHGDEKLLKHAAHELYAWSKAKHENILELLGVAHFRGRIAMISPWMENGSLSSYLMGHPDADRCNLSLQVAKGLTYLHGERIVHGDLKAANVVVSIDGIAKLNDFGHAVLVEYTLGFSNTSNLGGGTLRWMAPELFEMGSKRSLEADVYALGMTILETITGQVPFAEHIRDEAVLKAVITRNGKPKRPDSIPASSKRGNLLWRILNLCWSRDPEARPTAGFILDMMYNIVSSDLDLIPDSGSQPGIHIRTNSDSDLSRTESSPSVIHVI